MKKTLQSTTPTDAPDPSQQPDEFRETVEVATGPNITGHDDMAAAAGHSAPDPAVVDDPEAPDVPAPTPRRTTEEA